MKTIREEIEFEIENEFGEGKVGNAGYCANKILSLLSSKLLEVVGEELKITEEMKSDVLIAWIEGSNTEKARILTALKDKGLL